MSLLNLLASAQCIRFLSIINFNLWIQGFTMLMNGSRIQDLKRMYMLFSRVNALESLRKALSSYIRKTGQGIVTDDEKDKDMVLSLLEFKASIDAIWEDSFSKNEGFCNTIKEAFEHLINIRQVPYFCAISHLICYILETN